MGLVRLLALLVVTVSFRAALAQPAPNAAADAALQEGRRLYNVQDWDAAIAKFKDAYKLRPDAASLFNIAQSYRLKGDCAAAAIQYRTYRRNYPAEKNIPKVDAFIVEMDECAAKAPPPPPVENPPPPPSREVPVVVPPPAGSRPLPVLRWGGVAAIGVGAVGLGLGVKYALDGRAANDDLAAACAVSCASADALAIEDAGNRANRRMVVFTAVGGALVIGGVVMVVLSRDSSKEATHVSITPTRGGAAAVFEGRF